MLSVSTSALLPRAGAAPASQSPLAILCLSLHWQAVEQQTLWLASRLQHTGRPITLVVWEGSPLHEQAQRQWLPCFVLVQAEASSLVRRAALLNRWLQRHHTGLLVTTRTADLGVASLVKRWQRQKLRLVHRQLEPLSATSRWPYTWWQNWQMQPVDAWLAPLPQVAQALLTTTALDGRRLWVVPPALPPYFTNGNGGCTPTEARRLLDLPLAPQLIGVLDCGGDGPSFALEALYRLRQEHGSNAELIIMGGPATPPDAERWGALRQLAQQLRLSHCVHLRPLHNTAAPFLFYSALNALLLPTPPDATCLSLLNAMASGCPLVSAATPDATDLLQHGQTAHLFGPHDIASCAQLLCNVLADPARASRLAQRAAAYAQHHYSPVQQCQQLESILEFVGRHETLG